MFDFQGIKLSRFEFKMLKRVESGEVNRMKLNKRQKKALNKLYSLGLVQRVVVKIPARGDIQ